MNKVCLVGRTTKDWELKYTPGNSTATVSNSIAVPRDMKNTSGQYESDFINIVVWGKTAEFISKHSAKGKLVELEGRIQTRNYTNKDGNKVYITEIVVDKIKPIEWAKNEGTSGQTPPTVSSGDASIYDDQLTPVDDGDIPF